jgi:hypothetical protein
MSSSASGNFTLSSSASSSAASAPPIPGSVLQRAQVSGPRAVLQQRAQEAAEVARDAAADSDDLNKAHAVIEAKHRKMFLQKAFGINPDGTPIVAQGETVKMKTYKSVKSVQQHEDIIRILTHWGDDAALAAVPEDDPEAALIKRFRRNNKQGYNYIKFFELEETEALDGSLKTILKHKNSGGIVLHMLDLFDVIKEAHCQLGHLRVDKTLAACQPAFYSPTYELCKIYCENCYVCHEQTPVIEPKKGAKKPIISSEFRDCFQVDLIDMRSMRKKDVYGVMQRWIMTVKDHSTGLVYLAALPRKKADYVAAELEKYFGFVGYPHVFHTGTYNVVIK